MPLSPWSSPPSRGPKGDTSGCNQDGSSTGLKLSLRVDPVPDEPEALRGALAGAPAGPGGLVGVTASAPTRLPRSSAETALLSGESGCMGAVVEGEARAPLDESSGMVVGTEGDERNCAFVCHWSMHASVHGRALRVSGRMPTNVAGGVLTINGCCSRRVALARSFGSLWCRVHGQCEHQVGIHTLEDIAAAVIPMKTEQ